jgi:hypothetical protein
MPLLEWIGLVSFIFLLWAIFCIMPSLVALIAFNLTNIPLLGDIVVLIRITPMILEFCPDLSQRVKPDRNLPTTRTTSPEEEERIQQAT